MAGVEVEQAQIHRHREFPEELLHFLNQWVVNHLVNEDMKIADFIRHTGREPIGQHLYAEYLPAVRDGKSG